MRSPVEAYKIVKELIYRRLFVYATPVSFEFQDDFYVQSNFISTIFSPLIISEYSLAINSPDSAQKADFATTCHPPSPDSHELQQPPRPMTSPIPALQLPRLGSLLAKTGANSGTNSDTDRLPSTPLQLHQAKFPNRCMEQEE